MAIRQINGNEQVTLMGASGSGHAAGVVPDPGASAGSTRFLCEDATWVVPAGSGGISTQIDVTSLRTLGGVYTNTSPSIILVTGWATTVGSSTGEINFVTGPTGFLSAIYGNEATATVGGGKAGFFGVVLPGNDYQLVASGAVTSLGSCWETTLA